MNMAEQQQQFAGWTREHSAIFHHVVNGFAAGDDCNDLFQEVRLAVWKSIPAFRFTTIEIALRRNSRSAISEARADSFLLPVGKRSARPARMRVIGL